MACVYPESEQSSPNKPIPTAFEQVFRCYRYGQKKSVFCYRLLTDRTMEQKVYSRAVNKSSMALRLLDGKNPERCFTNDEIDNIRAMDDWVQCDGCDKWRLLPPDHTMDLAALEYDKVSFLGSFLRSLFILAF